MQEVLFRQRNLRHVEMTVVVSMFERLGHVLIDAVYGPAPDPAAHKARHEPLRADVDRLLKVYEAEVFEDRYLPAYQQAEAEEERRAKLDALERERREAEAQKRVAAFSEDEVPKR
jgi:hypothetical protein